MTCQQDALLAKQGPGAMREVFAPKASGAMELASLAAGAPVGASVLFSSVAGLLGSGGQASYSAANAAMDAWAAWQHMQACVHATHHSTLKDLLHPGMHLHRGNTSLAQSLCSVEGS